jgi:cardiolipin synthase A/B
MNGVLTNWATWMHLSGSVLGLLLYVFSTHALQQRRHPAAAMSWILCFFFVPYLALPAYMAFGQRKIPPRAGGAARASCAQADGDRRNWISTMLISMGAMPARADAQPVLHRDAGQAEVALWSLIDEARVRLYVSTYVLGNDRIGRQLIERLAARARAGLEVCLLLDGVGCMMVRQHRLRPLLDAGARVARSFPPLRRLLHRQANFRNHRKMVVADATWLWMGGRNFADEYFDGGERGPAWLDLSLHACGEIAHDADALFREDWRLATDVSLTPLPLPEAASPQPTQPGIAQLLGSGPDQPQDSLQALLVTGCFRAQERILIVTPYLIPDPVLLQALTLAARRGVSVDIVLPARSNHRLADHARSRAVRELALAGVSVWLADTMIHAKAVVFDSIGLTGSANLDSRSLFLNFELTMVLFSPQTTEELAQWILAHRSRARRYEPQPASVARDLYEGAVLWLGFQL